MAALRRWLNRVWTISPRALAALDIHYNEVLRDQRDVDEAVSQLRWAHPLYRAKTWDLLKALHGILRVAPERNARILDAGCAHSPILERLAVYGYRSLWGCDLTDEGIPPVPGLVFDRASLVHTPYPDGHFRAVTCISVIEHGVPLVDFFTEMRRLLEPGGHLFISTDYREPKLSTDDVDSATTLGLPWTIFCRSEMEDAVRLAERSGFTLMQPVRWSGSSSPVEWAGKRYTFIFLAFTRTGQPDA
jgi:SAM-dependent methyltransferase